MKPMKKALAQEKFREVIPKKRIAAKAESAHNAIVRSNILQGGTCRSTSSSSTAVCSRYLSLYRDETYEKKSTMTSVENTTDAAAQLLAINIPVSI